MEKKQKQDRIRALERFQQGESVSSIANSLGYSRRWVYKWIERSRVANVEIPWPEDRSRRPHANPRSCSGEMVEAVKLARLHLYNQGLFCGAQAIVWELEEMEDHPSVRTINRILNREELTHRRTGRYESKGRRYPKFSAPVANEVHEMDYVGPCYLQGPIRL
jgi:putative transposase